MKRPLHLLFLLCTTSMITLASLSGLPAQAQADTAPKLVGTYPLPGDTFDSEIVFYFDQPLAPVEEPNTLIHFEPAIQGTWSQGERYVRFTIDPKSRPSNGLYRAHFQPALQGLQGAAVTAPAAPVHFTNFRFDVAQVDFGSIERDTAQVRLSFNAAVSWEQLQQHLALTDSAGETVPFTAPRRGPSRQHVLTIPTTTPTPIRVDVSQGLSDANGTFSLKQPVSRTLESKEPFRIQEITWTHVSARENQLKVNVSYPVDHGKFLNHFRVVSDRNGAPLKLRPADSGSKQELTYRFDRPIEPYDVLRYTFTGDVDTIPALYPQSQLQGDILLKRQPLRINYHNWAAEGADPLRLELYFNGPIDPESLAAHVTIQPALSNMTVKPGAQGSVDLHGDWVPKTNYKLLIAEGLTDRADRLLLEKPLAWNAGAAPERKGIGFAFEAPYYFPRRTAGPIPVYGRNIEEANATLYELFPSNLVRSLGMMQSGKAPSQFGHNLARKIAEHTVQFSGDENTRLQGAIPLDGFMPEDRKGVFGVAISPAYDYYNTKIVVWTDIGVLAHWQDGGLLIYTHNLWDLAPLADARITVYSSKHQVMGELTTGADGVARLNDWDPELGRPAVLVVETENDFTFLQLKRRNEDPVAYEDTMPPYDPDGYDAFLYADRNLYRPGETMHVRWLVREADGSPLTGAPLLLRVTDPKDGKHEYTETLSDWGSGTLDLETKKNWLTGAYQLALFVPGSARALATATINVEDFVPNRLAATIETTAPYWLPGETHDITVHGDHLSGGPARERKTGAAIILTKESWKPDGWDAYSFSNDTPFKTDIRELGDGETDDAGNATYAFTWQPPRHLDAPVTATLRGEVFEAGGRSVAARKETTFFPADTLVGLAVSNSAQANTVDVAVAAVHANGRPAPVSEARITVEKKQWRYYLRRFSDRNEANWHDDFEVISEHSINLADGKGTVSVPVPSGYGTYRVKVHLEHSPQFATQSFWAYRGQAHLADASKPSLIELAADKKVYHPGDTANIRVTSPFDGNAIVVLQRDGLEELTTVSVENGVGTLSIPLEARHCPNVWVHATVIHPVEPGTALTYPYASFAMLNLPVHDQSKALGVRFEGLPEVTRPKTTLPVTVHVTNADGTPVAAEVTLALVDEGIHQILQYQNPDPVAWFQRPRRPDFRRAHYYDQVAYDFTGKPIGGGALLKKRLGEDDATVDENWIKPLALWSGVVETDATGVATIPMEFPEFAGKVRLVAVATTGSEAGSTDAQVTVRRPVVLQTTLPRFVAPGDTFQATALLQNKQDTPTTATLRVSAAEPLHAEPFEQSWEIPGGGEVVTPVPLAAGDLTGSGNITWHVEATGPDGALIDEATIETALKVQAPSVYQTRGELVVIPAGAEQAFTNAEFKANDRYESSIRVTPNALARLSEALDYVVGYPYGCVEQTTSRCLPLFLLGQAASQAGSEWDAAYFKQFVQAGIDRLLAMQTQSGGLGYWPGARDPYPYGTVYAAHFLTLAKQDPAFTVPEDDYNRLMTYVKERIPLSPGDGYRSIYTYAYSCYVRALTRDPKVMEDITSLDTLRIATTSRQWLALAQLIFTGDADQTRAYLLNSPSEPHDVREQGHTLNSPIRRDAITLMTQMKMGVDIGLIQPQAEKLVRFLENHRYSTQEAAFVIAALSEYLKTHAGDVANAGTAIATPDGLEERSGDFQFTATHTGANGRYTVANNGTTPLYVHHTQAGILLDPDVAAASNGITIEREFLGPNGPIDNAALQHGTSYLAAITLTCSEDLENVVLVDLLPGGLDIENPRLDGDALAQWNKTDGIRPDYIDVRDDRLIGAFDQLKRGTHQYYYAVRAVTPGTFRQPGANAECMYAVEINGRTAEGQVTIAQ